MTRIAPDHWTGLLGLSLAGVASLASQPALAQDSPVRIPPRVTQLLDAMAQGDRAAAVARLDRVEMLGLRQQVIRTPVAFVDALAACGRAQVEIERIDREATRVRALFPCPDGNREAMLSQTTGLPYVTVDNIFTLAETAQRISERQKHPAEEVTAPADPAPSRALPVIIPPSAPPPRSPEETARRERIAREIDARNALACQAIGQAVMDNDASGLAPMVGPQSNFGLVFFDPFYDHAVVDTDDQGLSAAQALFNRLRELLGQPAAYTCQREDHSTVLRIAFDQPDRTAVANIHAPQVGYGERLGSLSFRFSSAERVEAARLQHEEELASP